MKNEPKPIVVALGKNWVEYPPKPLPLGWNIELSVESKITALAAGELYNKAVIDEIVFSTGKTAGKDWPSEAEAMRDYMLKFYPKIPAGCIHLEEQSIDNVGNAFHVKPIVCGPAIREIWLLTVGYHLSRSTKIFKRIDLQTVGIASENVLRGTKHAPIVEEFRKSSARRIEYIKEFILRMILLVDPDGKLLRKLTRKLRHAE